MNELRFGGAIATILDPHTSLQLHPRCMGMATLSAPTDEATVRTSITNHVAQQLTNAMRSGKSFNQAAIDPSLASLVAAAVSAELHISVSITMLNVTISDDEQAALRSGGATAVATAATTTAPAVIGPGSRVIATWQDGRQFPATVRSFNGTQYEIMWDGQSTTTWVPANAVRPA
jgi:hypothetical protein